MLYRVIQTKLLQEPVLAQCGVQGGSWVGRVAVVWRGGLWRCSGEGGAREGQWRSGSGGGQGDSWPTNLITAAEMETLIPGEGN